MSLPLTFRFDLTNEDLETAYNARLDHVCKPAFRYVLISLGCLAFFGPILAFLCRWNSSFGLIDVVFLIIGVILLRAWAIAPILNRRRIRMNSGATAIRRIIIDENNVIEESGDSPKNTRAWDEIIRIADTSKGFLIYFQDGQIWWLPTRIFSNIKEHDEFMNLAAQKGKLR